MKTQIRINWLYWSQQQTNWSRGICSAFLKFQGHVQWTVRQDFALKGCYLISDKVISHIIWKLDHIPSSCIVLRVHMVNGRQYSACTVYRPHPCRRLNRKDGVWNWLSTSTVTSFDASITGDELDSAVQLPNFSLIDRDSGRVKVGQRYSSEKVALSL